MDRLVRMTSLFVALMTVSASQAAEGVVSVPEVEVRSGPSTEYYATGKLRQGEQVQIENEQNGFLAIVAPAGSFSLILKDQVKAQPGQTGVVMEEGAETIVGSSVVNTYNVRGTKLSRGYVVTIIDEVAVPGGKAYYRIAPPGEFRYIPSSAVQKQPSIVLAGGTSAAAPGAVNPAFDSATSAMVQQAEECYRKAEATGDWSEAKRCYEEMSKGQNHEARMIAWNRLEFIRKKMSGQAAPAYQASRFAVPAAPATRVTTPRAGSTYTYGTDNGPAKLIPVPVVPPAPAGKATPLTTAQFTPATPTATTANLQSTGPARLRRGRQTAEGQRLYYLEGSRGELRCYVAASPGLNLEPFVDQIVDLQATPMVYRTDLRSNLITAVHVVPVAQ